MSLPLLPGMPGLPGLAATPSKGVSFNLDAFMAAQADGFSFDTTITSSTWQDTSAVTPADDVGEAIGRIDDQRTGTGSPHNGTQGTGTLKPLRQTTGAKFDGLGGNWLTDYTAGAGENFIVALVTVPATLGANQVFCGAVGAGIVDRCALGVANATGQLAGAVGNQGQSVITGGPDLRGTRVVVGLTFNGSTVKLFAGESEVYSAAQSGVPTTSIPFCVGASNIGGDPAAFWAGAVEDARVGRQYLDLATFRQIGTALLA